jgi:hydrogenase expression/formation protein HypC
MCLGVPGKVVRLDEGAIDMPMGVVSFGGVMKEVCFAYTPEVVPGDWVLVHVGFAISKLDEEHALEVFRTLKELGELSELDVPQPERSS